MPALALGLLCQCQVGLETHRVVTLQPGDDVSVTYSSGQALKMELVHSGSMSVEEAYSGENAHPGLKVAPLYDLQNLLDKFASHDFFKRSYPTPPTDTEQVLKVRINGRIRYLGRPPLDLAHQSQIEDFVACKSAFTDIFNVYTAFSSSGRIDSDQVQRVRSRFRKRTQNITEMPKDKVGEMPKWQGQGTSGKVPPEGRTGKVPQSREPDQK